MRSIRCLKLICLDLLGRVSKYRAVPSEVASLATTVGISDIKKQ